MLKRVVAICICLASFAPATAWAQSGGESDGAGSDRARSGGAEGAETEKAKEEFKALSSSAQKKFQSGDLEGAIADFEAAYALRPVSNILYNIGRIHEKLGNIDEAIAYYERFAVAPNVEISARKDAVSRLKTLREVQEIQKGSDDGADSGDAGTAAPDQGAAGEPGSSAGSAGDEASDGSVDRTAAWVFLGIGATTLVGAGVFGVLTQMEHTTYEDAVTLQQRRDAASTGQTFGYVSDGLLITGAVTTVLGAIFWFTAGPDESEGVGVAPVVTSDRAGVGMYGRF